MNITRSSRLLIRNIRALRFAKIPRTHPVIFSLDQKCITRNFCTIFSKSPDYSADNQLIDLKIFEPICTATLESLTEYFEEIVEADSRLTNSDINYSDGVLTVKLGDGFGTYVINRQTPNRQIWLSSPVSGPKRYDLINGDWIYKHDGISLYTLLQQELEKIMLVPVDFNSLKK